MRKNLHLMLCSLMALCLSSSTWSRLHAQQSISLGDYGTTTEHFRGSVGQKAPFDFDYKYSRSQQIYTAEDLNGLEGKEISEIRMRVYNQDAAVYEQDYQVTLRLYLTNIEETDFKKLEGETNYRWHSIDPATDLCATEVIKIDFLDKNSEDFEVVLKLSKPFVYRGKSMLMTVESEANTQLGGVSQSYIDFYCYPKNVKDMPIRTLYKAHDTNNVAQPEGYGNFSDGSGLKQRAVLQIFYKDAGASGSMTSDDDPLDPINPIVTVKTPGKISEQLSTISDLTKCLSLTVKGTMTETDVKFIQDRMGGLTKIDLKAATIQGNVLPKTAFSKHPNLQEVILPLTLTKIDDSALSDMPKLQRVVMGNGITEIGMNAFALSKALSDIVWSDKLEFIRSHAFSECKALKKADLPNSVTTIEQYAFQKSGLVSFKTPENLQNLSRMCFYQCADLEELYITDQVEKLEFKSFGECAKLARVTCMRATPPQAFRNAFDRVNLATAVLYVAEESLIATYKNADVWKNFGNIAVNESPKKYFNLTYKNEYEGGKVKAYQGETLLPAESKVEENSTVRFVAEPNEGYLLKKWHVNSVESDATGLEFSVKITGETKVEALFAEAYKRFKITFQSNDAEWGKVTAQINGQEIQSESIHKADQTVVLTAHPAKNYHLRHWLVNGKVVPKQGEKNLEVVLNKQTLVEAVFERDELFYQLSVSLADNNGSLYAYVGGARISLSSKLKEGTIVEIFAEPEDHYLFDYWKINGEVSERKEPTLRITMDKDYRIEAFFKKKTAIESVTPEETLTYQVQAGTLSVNYPIEGATIVLLNLKGELMAREVVQRGAVRFAVALEGIYLVRVEGTTQVKKVLMR